MPSLTSKALPKIADQAGNLMQVLVIDDSETDRQRILRLCEEAGLNFIATEVSSIVPEV